MFIYLSMHVEEEEELEPANSVVCSIEFLPLGTRLPAANARVLAP